ncbi:MAG: SAM-dependent methyltransferase [Anaerolineales bacterium]|uniref:SAM-dependent methyltransferase n=1 Tax=Candidatus Desulfolinea nitratireducens TaxID=2841698 RepID=A0A8J6NMT6_9CHLR|nr:SAM-dependent methyltransferase [Candidatus Desulfolinea nitratireducens]MBL6961744.1 SAM-dependent methyltransferase [Anaerolineales bacterium]
MTISKNKEQHPASFRDPNGFLFTQDSVLYRQINQKYTDEYKNLIESGLYDSLRKSGRLVTHQEVDIAPIQPEKAFQVLQPERLPFISYPYEWSFSQLKSAALTTLAIQKRALNVGMSLKDASAYNIQFYLGKAMLIDTLSFEFYQDGQPWVAYRQYCQHFLAPLALMAKRDIRLSQLLRVYIDGIPLDLASELLPSSAKLNAGLMMHIHLHAKAQVKYADENVEEQKKEKKISKQALLSLIDSLRNTIKKLEWNPAGTEWGNYYEITNYTDAAFLHKKELISEWIKARKPSQVWDLGANNGVFSRLASDQGIFTVSFDIDPAAVEQNYHQVKEAKEKYLLPLIVDLTNPSPALGWHNRERESFTARAPADMVFALALIHHLAISNNVPLTQLADFFHAMGKWLIIEFVPKSDSQVKILLQSREDVFDEYTVDDFERVFKSRFTIHKKVKINEAERHLYLMERR